MRQLEKFLKSYWDGKRPLLLGYSGGPDSKALLYGLLKFVSPSFLHVAHVDHGWREESLLEAEKIRQEIEELQICFHTIRLKSPKLGNLEKIAREERLAFFQKLHQKFQFQGCLLAHQEGDLVETSLKRVLEGAHLPFLGGMEEVSSIDGLPLWRPLLRCSRKEILEFLASSNLKPLFDPSNEDKAYLRARMRMEIFPFLNEKLGKGVQENLALLSERSWELKKYLDRKIVDRKLEEGAWGKKASFLGLERIEARHLLQKFNLSLPRQFLESILDALLLAKPDCFFSDTLFVDRGVLFLTAYPLPQFGSSLPLSLGKHVRGDWQIEVLPWTHPLPNPRWEDVWRGSFSVELPEGVLALPAQGTSFRKLWNEKKIPSFLRFQTPLFSQEGKEVKEFLSGDRGCSTSSVFHVNLVVNHSV